MLATLRSCKQKFALEYLHSWKPKRLSHHLHAGAAFAKGLEITRRSFFEQGLGEEDSVAAGLQALLAHYGDFQPPNDSAKTAARMAGALEFYFSCWPLASDPAKPSTIGGKRGIEFCFATPLPLNHPTTHEPLIMSGRSDMICDYAGGRFIEDDKTASQLGATWGRQWDLRSQFTSYCWGARTASIAVQGVLVRAVSILKKSYDKAEAVTYRPDWQVDRWLAQTVRDIKGAITCWEEGYWDWSLDHACNEYGGCAFRQICLQQDPQPFLDLNFERRHWDPLTRTETLLGEAREPQLLT